MDRLLELQGVDSDVDRLTARRAELEAGGEVSAARAAVDQAEGALGELRLALDSLASEQRRLESDVDAFARKAADEEKRLYDGSIVNTRELEAIQAEIRSAKDHRSRKEDELLEAMERREDLELQIEAAEAEVTKARARLEATGGDAARELDDVARTLEARATERGAIVPEIDEELLELYEDLREQKKGVGAVALEDGVCNGCHQKLSPLELDRLKRTEGVKRCDYCRRILIFA